MAESKNKKTATLALADGTVFKGRAVGADGEATGEVVFNTSMSGYQEILTDPSYVYQMLTFTTPHIGNVGFNSEDVESKKVQVAGFICREISEHYSNFRAQGSLGEYLRQNNVVGIDGIDTRALVLHLRTYGSQMGVIATGDVSPSLLVDRAKTLASMNGLDLAKEVTCKASYIWKQRPWEPGAGYTEVSDADYKRLPHIVAMDFGIKFNILRLLVGQGFRVTVVPAQTSAEEILAMSPDGIFLSNGPGDPAAVTYAIGTIKKLVGKKPLFGICLGHQLLGLSQGAQTYKLKFGHRGGNHPVRNELSRKVEITAQNHGFAVDQSRMPSGVTMTHINLNDQTVEGLEIKDANAFSVQYHPEASPGPTDARYLFKQFRDVVYSGAKLDA
uniref:carbamoyl-phosphate synthase (glutamine-hydrolyzing) n=1 Tax=wastewater metagenome TaxID=527639 RepID=A0A0A8KXH8_9ZZZZ